MHVVVYEHSQVNVLYPFLWCFFSACSSFSATEQ